jgi:hypothetical protein
VVEPKEAADVIREAGDEAEHQQRHPINRTVAMLVAIMAALLAIATISTGATTRRLLNDSIHLSDLHSKADVGDVRQSNALVTADLLQSILDTTNATGPTRSALEQKINDYRAAASVPAASHGESGQDESVQQQISDYDGAEETTESQILSFEYSEVILQVGIILASLAILTRSWGIFWVSATLGGVGLILIINGYFGAAHLPAFV